jgi:hypothetical protein
MAWVAAFWLLRLEVPQPVLMTAFDTCRWWSA